MFKRGMDSKGQLSVEYLFLLMIILVVFGFMITNFIGPSIDASNDISKVSAASNAVNNIANAANIVYSNGPQSKRTLGVYIPNNTIITCNYSTSDSTGSVNGYVTLSNGSIKTVSAKTIWRLDPHTYNSSGYHTATVFWLNSGWRLQNTMT